MALVPARQGLGEQAQKREGRSAFASACKAAADSLEKGDVPQSEKAIALKAIETAEAWITSNPTAAVGTMEEKRRDMERVAVPIALQGKLNAYCKEVSASLSAKNFEPSEKAVIEKALAVAHPGDGKAATKEDLEAKFKALGDAVNPIMVQVNKRAGAVSGQMTYLKDGGYYFEADAPPSKARLLLEEITGAVFIDLDECADDNSLACIIEDLQQRVQRGDTQKVIILTIEARADHPAMHRHLLRSGAFMVGLRSLCIPIMGVISGRVAGPAWSLFLACDYRLAVQGTRFHLPICSAPHCLQTLVGPSIATELCLSTSTLDCHAVLELGFLAQARPTFEEAKYAAYEQAKRIAGFPHIGLRQTITLLNPAAQLYANAIAEDPSIMMQVYPDDLVTNQ